MEIRSETKGDRAAIRSLVADAFGQAQEADLVDSLREAGDLAVSLVAAQGCRLLGHVGLSRLRSPERSLALAPLAVAEAARNRGVGAQLVRAALERAKALGCEIVFVVGEPAYYERLGFSAKAAAAYPCAYAGPYFMALSLAGARTAPAPVIYAPAFDGLSGADQAS